MLIVVKGKVVDGRRIIELGGELDGLSPEAEEQLIAAGVAARVDALDAGEIAAAGEVPQEAPAAKQLSKAELQAVCREYGLSDRGTKAELQARIAEYEDAAAEADDLEDDELPDLVAEVPR